eukprot:CAMPEP_0119401654 /NCGR_PEP_ID=MMETSP1334-20130426/142483_1 /TAXON_ID=127549 /ORGANISM="Calcidiscus leptoporus, Strain RCC1130" /LENGTH=217 /DNA_ID=CAMNT_0007425575 /DNA_START=9 /DNA_END=662 /DNA_ORIENTATION=-
MAHADPGGSSAEAGPLILPPADKSEANYWQARWREEHERANDLSKRVATLEESWEKSERVRRELEASKLRRSAEATREYRQALADRSALKDARAEAAALQSQCEHWRREGEAALLQRDEAQRRAKALRDDLADAPGHADGATVAQMRVQLTAALERKASYKSVAREQANKASSLLLQVRELEAQLEKERALPPHERRTQKQKQVCRRHAARRDVAEM